jgi:tetratricopeptide (TPR) repeat protein
VTDLDLPLHGPALYNPHLLSKEEFLGLFSARQALLEEFLDDLRSTPPGESAQHHLILGQRGMGKTMLLRRIQFGVEDDPELNQNWLPLSFPEEQYNVAALSDFWLNCIDALSDTLERLGLPRPPENVENVVEGLDKAVEALRKEPEDERANRALDVLVSTASALDRRLLLLVDNADLVLDRVGEQDWSLREVLSSQPNVTFLGASAAAIESTYEYGKAFYDFFRIHHLTGLTVDETQHLLLQYAEAQANDDVRRIVEEAPGRLRTLHTLTGGNPRTLVLLFNIFVNGPDGDVRSDVEQLLDQCTPLYKARFEALPAQAQQVVDALALHWDPASAGELAEALRMPVNNVSAQLNRLANQGVVEKVPYEPESKTGFQIGERFFNIWYLMRASRRVRRRLLWLVEFLRMFYSQDELRRRVERYLRVVGKLDPRERLRHAEYSFALASALEEERLQKTLECSALQMLSKHEQLYRKLQEVLDFEGADTDLRDRAEYLDRLSALRHRLSAVAKEAEIVTDATFADRLVRLPAQLELKEVIAKALLRSDPNQAAKLLQILDRWEASFFSEVSSEDSKQLLLRAVNEGYMAAFDDIDGAILAEAALGVAGLAGLAAAARVDLSGDRQALVLLEDNLQAATSPYPWLVWLEKSMLSEKPASPVDSPEVDKAIAAVRTLARGDAAILLRVGRILALQLKRPELAEEVFQEAIANDPENDSAWYMLGNLWMDQGENNQAESAFRKSLGKNDSNAMAWSNLGTVLSRLHQDDEAEKAFRKAIHEDPSFPCTWHYLGDLLSGQSREVEAEQIYRRGLEVDEEHTITWYKLAMLFRRQKRHVDAEHAFRKVLDRDPALVCAWHYLGDALKWQNHLSEAEEAYRKAITVDPGHAQAWLALGFYLQERGKAQEAEAAFRKASEVDPAFPCAWHELGDLLSALGRYEEAEYAFRRSVELDSEHSWVWHKLGDLFQDQGKDEEAERAYRRAIDESFDSPEASNYMAWILFERDHFLDDAERLALAAVSPNRSNPAGEHTLACVLVRRNKWSQAVGPARKFLRFWAADIPEGLWPDILLFFREAVASNRAREAAELLDEVELAKRWRPLREALEALAREDPKYLRRVAPEVRGPAEVILKELSEPPEERT